MSIKNLDFDRCRVAVFNGKEFASEEGSLVLYDDTEYSHGYDRTSIAGLVRSERIAGIIIDNQNVQDLIMTLLDVQSELSRPDFSAEEKFKPLQRVNAVLDSICAT